MDSFYFLVAGGFNFFLELFIPSLILSRKQKIRKRFPIRVILCVLLASLVYFIPFQIRIGPFMVVFPICFIFCIFFLYFCFEVSIFDCFYVSIASFAMQHLAWNFIFLFYDNIPNLDIWLVHLIYILGYSFIYALALLLLPPDWMHNFKPRTKALLAIVSFIALCVTYGLGAVIPFSYHWSIYERLYAIISCVLILLFQFITLYQTKIETENDELTQDKYFLEELLKKEKKQYLFSKQTVETLNMKSHDLKKQINALRTISQEDRNEALDELEQSVDMYDSLVKTGNEVLDVLLFEKVLYAKNNNISFTYLVDGTLVNNIDPIDLASLIGNALDNAFEHALKENEDRRLIKMHLYKQSNYLVLKLENYCSKEVKFENGIPLTSKENKQDHGYGTKSMQMIATKYNGHISFKLEDKVFTFVLIIPFR